MSKKIQRVLVDPKGEKTFVGYVLLENFNTVEELFEDETRSLILIYTLDCRATKRLENERLDQIEYHTRRYNKSAINYIREYSEQDATLKV